MTDKVWNQIESAIYKLQGNDANGAYDILDEILKNHSDEEVTGCFVVKVDNEYLGVDSGSGGYPFTTKNFASARIWFSEDEYESYKKAFSRSTTYTDTSKWKKYQISLEETD